MCVAVWDAGQRWRTEDAGVPDGSWQVATACGRLNGVREQNGDSVRKTVGFGEKKKGKKKKGEKKWGRERFREPPLSQFSLLFNVV